MFMRLHCPSVKSSRSRLSPVLAALLLAMAAPAAWAGPFSAYLQALQPLPPQLPVPQPGGDGLAAVCAEGAAADEAKAATRTALVAAVEAEAGAYEAGLDPDSMGSRFAPSESADMACATRFRSDLNHLRYEQQRLAREYSALRSKTLQQRQTCRPAFGGEKPEDLQAECESALQTQLATPYAESAQKMWPAYWISTQARVERLRRELSQCVARREKAEEDAFRNGALRRGNAAMAAFMKATREPAVEFADLRRAVCKTVEAPLLGSQWRHPGWMQYGPAADLNGQPLQDQYSLKELP